MMTKQELIAASNEDLAAGHGAMADYKTRAEQAQEYGDKGLAARLETIVVQRPVAGLSASNSTGLREPVE